jgi:hypothetical protein
MKIAKRRSFRAGQNRRSLEERERLLVEFELSGKTRPEYAREKGIPYPTIAGWMQRRRRKQKALVGVLERKMEKPTFAEALIPWNGARTANAEGMEIDLGKNIKLRVNRQEQIAWTAELIRLLGRSPQC